MVMGYTMYRQLSLHKFVKNKKQRAIFTKTLVDPGKLNTNSIYIAKIVLGYKVAQITGLGLLAQSGVQDQ